jgi:hypothetical protein
MTKEGVTCAPKRVSLVTNDGSSAARRRSARILAATDRAVLTAGRTPNRVGGKIAAVASCHLEQSPLKGRGPFFVARIAFEPTRRLNVRFAPDIDRLQSKLRKILRCGPEHDEPLF